MSQYSPQLSTLFQRIHDWLVSLSRKAAIGSFCMLLGAAASVYTFKDQLFGNQPLSETEIRAVFSQEVSTALSRAIVDASDAFGNSVIEVSSETKATGQVEVEFYRQFEARVNFASGEQSISDDYRNAKVAFAAFRFLSYMKESAYSDRLQVSSVFTGGADGQGGSGYVGAYDGSLGAAVSIDAPLVNGTRQPDVFIEKGDGIRNSDLALLRAYSVFASFYDHIRDEQIWIDQMDFVGVVSGESGAKHRFGTVKVIVSLNDQVA